MTDSSAPLPDSETISVIYAVGASDRSAAYLPELFSLLEAFGISVTVFAPEDDGLRQQLSERSVRLCTTLGELPPHPSLLHGSSHRALLPLLLAFPETPAVASGPWDGAAAAAFAKIGNIVRFFCEEPVDAPGSGAAEMSLLMLEHRIPNDAISLIPPLSTAGQAAIALFSAYRRAVSEWRGPSPKELLTLQCAEYLAADLKGDCSHSAAPTGRSFDSGSNASQDGLHQEERDRLSQNGQVLARLQTQLAQMISEYESLRREKNSFHAQAICLEAELIAAKNELAGARRERNRLRSLLVGIENSATIRLRNRLLSLPGVPQLIRVVRQSKVLRPPQDSPAAHAPVSASPAVQRSAAEI